MTADWMNKVQITNEAGHGEYAARMGPTAACSPSKESLEAREFQKKTATREVIIVEPV